MGYEARRVSQSYVVTPPVVPNRIRPPRVPGNKLIMCLAHQVARGFSWLTLRLRLPSFLLRITGI